MEPNDTMLGYEVTYQDRLDETRNMITLATLLESLDQGISDSINYRSVMEGAYAIASKSNPTGRPSGMPDITIVSNVI